MTRLPIPALFSMAAAIMLMLPYASVNRVGVDASNIEYVGANSFQCKIKKTLFAKDNIEAMLSHHENSFYLNLTLDNEHSNQLTFILREEEITAKVYELNSSSDRYITFNFEGVDCLRTTDEFNSGMLMIHKYDSVNKIIAGSFEFLTYSEQCEEVIFVSEGTFDVRYNILEL
jgi:Family of unknown function (DUF6252)